VNDTFIEFEGSGSVSNLKGGWGKRRKKKTREWRAEGLCEGARWPLRVKPPGKMIVEDYPEKSVRPIKAVKGTVMQYQSEKGGSPPIGVKSRPREGKSANDTKGYKRDEFER